jgi:nucleotide-binding universal stress UspA family protein
VIGASFEAEVRHDEAVALVEHVAEAVRADHPTLEVSAFVVPAHRPEAIVAAAGDATLLVVGTHGSGATKALVLGSVAAALPRLSHCPVVIVPPRQEPPRSE